MKKSIVERLFFFKLYRESKKYFFGFVIFFLFLIGVPAFIHIDFSPLFRGWGLFKDKQYVQPYYINLRVVVNNNPSLKVLGGNGFGALNFYLDFATTHQDNQRLTYRKAMNKVFPGYINQEINSLSDTTKFKQWYKNYLSRNMHISVRKISVFEEKIKYNAEGYAIIEQCRLLKEF